MLIETPAAFVRNYKLQLKAASTDTIKGWVQLGGANKGSTVQLRIPEAGIDKSFTTNDAGRAEFEFSADLSLWSPQSPKLYEVQWQLDENTLGDTIGFRTIETRGEDILLNGQAIFLKGVSLHEESMLRHGRANSQRDADAAIFNTHSD
jgi:beta-glucuronidase